MGGSRLPALAFLAVAFLVSGTSAGRIVKTCGFKGQVCCNIPDLSIFEGECLESRTACWEGVCQKCGKLLKPVCKDDDPLCDPGLIPDDNGVCVRDSTPPPSTPPPATPPTAECGEEGDACCVDDNGLDICFIKLNRCLNGICKPCGTKGKPVCEGDEPCTDGLEPSDSDICVPIATPPPTTPPSTPPPSSEPPTAEPPSTEPPTSEPPTVEPPTAEPPTSEPPTTPPPTTEPPTAEPPITEPPTVEPPTAKPPTSKPPSTQPPTSEPPTAEPPITEPPTVEPPSTEPPTSEPPTSEPPSTPPAGIPPTATPPPAQPPIDLPPNPLKSCGFEFEKCCKGVKGFGRCFEPSNTCLDGVCAPCGVAGLPVCDGLFPCAGAAKPDGKGFCEAATPPETPPATPPSGVPHSGALVPSGAPPSKKGKGKIFKSGRSGLAGRRFNFVKW